LSLVIHYFPFELVLERSRRDCFSLPRQGDRRIVENAIRARPLAGTFHPCCNLTYRQDLDITAIAGLSQTLQNVFEQGEAVGRLDQIFGMQAEMKYPTMADSGFQPAAEALET
jgi:hypothetical protein